MSLATADKQHDIETLFVTQMAIPTTMQHDSYHSNDSFTRAG